jgi:hypothetical protein
MRVPGAFSSRSAVGGDTSQSDGALDHRHDHDPATGPHHGQRTASSPMGQTPHRNLDARTTRSASRVTIYPQAAGTVASTVRSCSAALTRSARLICSPTRGTVSNDSTLAVTLHLGECRTIFETDADTGSETLWLLAGDAWASISGGRVLQAGARNLWDDAVAAYQWWITQDRPDRRQFHLTVTRERQWVWLDDPANTVTTALPNQP